jgi:hypothetical protein
MLLQTNSYKITIFITITSCISFLIDYGCSEFTTRFFMFTYFDGVSGTFHPIMSSLKSQMIPEKLRTTIMNFFKIPINIVAILLLVLSKLMTTYEVIFFFIFNRYAF